MILDFNKIEKNCIRSLIDIRLTYRSTDINFLRSRFNDEAAHFEQIFLFLVQSNILKDDGSLKDYKSKKLKSVVQSEDSLNKFLINIILDKKSLYNDYVNQYFEKFELNNNELTYTPFSEEKFKYSGIRNLLSDVGLVSLGQNSSYHINFDYQKKVLQKKKQAVITPKRLNKILSEKNKIGLLAELRIVEYEKNRLKGLGINNDVEHVAMVNVALGYDIKSWETENNKRYIEVKAVSKSDYKFHWSKNEIEISEKYGDEYFLYLLPVKDNKTFDIDLLVEIKNPYDVIFKKDSDYQKESEQYLVWK